MIQDDEKTQSKVSAVLVARKAGHDDIANQLLAELVTTADDAFQLMLTYARHAAWPARNARQELAEQGLHVIELVPVTGHLPEPGAIAMRMVSAFANDDEAQAMDIAGMTTLRVMEPGSEHLPHMVIAALADICVQGGPNMKPVAAADIPGNPSAN